MISSYFLLLLLTQSICSQTIYEIFHCLKTNCDNEGGVEINVRNDSLVSIDHIPHTHSFQHQQSTSVSIKNLLSQIVVEANDNHGILIVEGGEHSNIYWKLKSPAQTYRLQNLSTFTQPQLQIALTENFPIYHFDSTNYAYYPENLLFVRSDVEISFELLSDEIIDCRGNALVFAIFTWDENIAAIYNQSINFETSQQCQICQSLHISRTWIRMCPFVQKPVEDNPSPTTESLCLSTISPTVHLNSSSINSSSVLLTTSDENHPKLRLTDDLRGLFVDCGLGDMSNFGFVDCDAVFESVSNLGKNPTCEGSENGFLITFGKNATVKLGQKLQLQQCSPAQLVSNVQASTKLRDEAVIVEEPISPAFPSFTVFYPETVLNCDTTVKVEVKQIQGNGDRDLEFEWNSINEQDPLAQLIAEEKSRKLELPGGLINGNISLTVRGCNYGGRCAEKNDVRITVVKLSGVFRVNIIGVPEIVFPSSLIRLQALPEFKSCNRTNIVPKNVEFEWSVNNIIVSTEDNYRIPSYKYFLGSKLNISIKAVYLESNDSEYTAYDAKFLTYEAEPLYISMDSARSRKHPVDRELLLDADACRDYNSVDSTMNHHWYCEVEDAKIENKSCGLTSLSEWDWKRPVLEIPAFTLEEGTKYKFMNYLKSSNSLNGSIQTVVTITEAESPLITVQPMKEREDNQDYIRIQAFVSSPISPLNVTWLVLQSNTSTWFDISHILKNSSTIFRKLPAKSIAVSLTIPPKKIAKYPKWTGLKPSSEYTVRLLASSQQGTSNYDITIRTAESPRTGKVEVYPRRNIVALQTLVKFEVGDGWDQLDTGKLLFRFGLTTIHTNHSSTIWMPQSSARILSVYLPSAWASPPACHDRIGCRAVLEACNEGTCRIAESEVFSVAPAQNISLTTANILSLINVDIKNSNFFSALVKLYALELEQCDTNLNSVLADQTIIELLKSIDSTSSSLEYREVLHAAYSLIDYVSKDVVDQVVHLIQTYRTFVGKMNSIPGARRRRSVPLTKSSSDKVNEAEAAAMLEIADNILGKDVVSAVDLYFITITDFLIGFCTQLDEKADRVMKAAGKLYTKIQAQSVNSNFGDFKNLTFSTAGILISNVAFTETFAEMFKQWSCGEYTTCYHVCLATARISVKAAAVNQQLQSRLHLDEFGTQTLNKSVSDLYKISFLDPMNGNDVNRQTASVLYNVLIPIINYQAANYYACHVIVDNGWTDSACDASDYPVEINNVIYQECSCTQTGILGVFKVHPPIAFPMPIHNEMMFTFNLTKSNFVSKNDLNTFVTRLVWATGLNGRLVKSTVITNSTMPVISLILRPPFRPNQISNSYATQAILKSVNPISGFKAYGNVTVVNTEYDIIERKLDGDLDARKIMMYIVGSYNSVVGNNSESLALTWASSLAESLGISPLRIRNAIIVPGILFNFTITKSFREEKDTLDAEEIALMVLEQVEYKEYNLQSMQGETLVLEPLTRANIVQLIARTEPNTLALILIVIISTWIFLCLLIVGGASIVKVRTERAIFQERQRVTIINPGDHLRPPLPQTSTPVLDVSNMQIVRHR